MTFSFTVLGSSAAIPVKERHLSAHLLNADERFFLFDCGEGTQFQLKRYHISFRRIQHIFISHLHGDHFFGLIGLLNSMHLMGRKDELHLWGPGLLEDIINIQLAASVTNLVYPLIFHPLYDIAQMIIDHPKYTVHSFPVKHRIPCYGFTIREKMPPRRIASPRSFAYCGDTAYCEDIIPNIYGVSLLYHEATFMNELAQVANEKFHSTAREAATIAQKAAVQKLVIGHFSARYESLEPLLEEAREVFPGAILAVEGQKIEL
jgi:ribonuclease Z